MEALERQVTQGVGGFDEWRQVELLKLAANFDPVLDSLIRIGMRPGVLPSGEDLAWLAKTNMWWAYSAIFGVQDLLPYPDLSDLAGWVLGRGSA